MTYVKSTIDNKYYLVRDLPDKLIACNMLAKIKENINKLILYLDENKDTKYKEYKIYIDRLKTRINNVNISENSGKGSDTSYSVNKGDELVLCLRSKINYNEFHNVNLIYYVVLHEISHIASPVYESEYNNHGPIFKKVFGFLTNIALELDLYHKIDFDKKPEEYCGIYINQSII
jgi:hypothetical protein